MNKIKAAAACLLLCGMITLVSKADNVNQQINTDLVADSETQIYSDTFPPLPCCRFIRGNVDNDPGDDIDINDLLYLVAYCYKGGPAPECMPEADVDASGSIQSAIDINYLVRYMFDNGPAPVVCPK